jgi:hypothetical protein
MIKAEFLEYHRFVGRYQRNNKAKGRKNLRCYPSCRSSGHVTTGFCGRPVQINVTYDAAAADAVDILAFAQFRVCPSPASAEVLLGSSFPFDEIVNRSRGTSHNPGGKALNPWFPGVVLDTKAVNSQTVTVTFSFNEGNQGWHYAWQSHRMTRQTRHCLHVFVLAARRDQQTSFTCVVELFSPSFDIFCRRKRPRNPDDPEGGSVYPMPMMIAPYGVGGTGTGMGAGTTSGTTPGVPGGMLDPQLTALSANMDPTVSLSMLKSEMGQIVGAGAGGGTITGGAMAAELMTPEHQLQVEMEINRLRGLSRALSSNMACNMPCIMPAPPVVEAVGNTVNLANTETLATALAMLASMANNSPTALEPAPQPMTAALAAAAAAAAAVDVAVATRLAATAGEGSSVTEETEDNDGGKDDDSEDIKGSKGATGTQSPHKTPSPSDTPAVASFTATPPGSTAAAAANEIKREPGK